MKDYKMVMTEKYNKDGVCIERSVNGYPLPPDTEPSVQIFTNCEWLEQKTYMTPEEVKNRYGVTLKPKE